jgi:hypothetical protein
LLRPRPIAFALVLLALDRPALASPDHQGSGPALVVGVGNQVGGLGGALHFYVRPWERPWQLSAHAGAGVRGISGGDQHVGAWTAGVSLIYGDRHRALLAMDYGLVRHRALALHGTFVAGRALAGPQLGLGYEQIGPTGYVFQAIVGAGYAISGPIARSERGLELVATLAMGWKPW